MSNTLKRQVLPGGLWVVATPIGNLADLSPRARQALEEAQAILCEDTRRTGTLMSALGLSRRLERLDAHATASRIDEVVERLLTGENLALVSDAGTPAISDPGALLVARAREKGVLVTPIAGPSAVVTLLSAAGFHETSFTFRGFFPRKEGERKKEIELVENAAKSGVSRVFSWFESPERVSEALASFAENASDTQVVAAKELTKLHERFFAGNASEAAKLVQAEIEAEGARGEWCFAVMFPEADTAEAAAGESEDDSSDWVKALHCLLNLRVPASGAAREVSQQFGVSRKRVYEVALRLSGKKSE